MPHTLKGPGKIRKDLASKPESSPFRTESPQKPSWVSQEPESGNLDMKTLNTKSTAQHPNSVDPCNPD